MNNCGANRFAQAASALGSLSSVFEVFSEWEKNHASEIRLRVGAPPQLSLWSGETVARGRRITGAQIDNALLELCGHALYCHQQEIASGYISVPGGHRAGICGTAVVDAGKVSAVRDVTTICLRIAGEHRGCSGEAMSLLFPDGVCSAVIAGPPCSGKTTLLRDLACSLAAGKCGSRLRVAVIDERGELGLGSGREYASEISACCDVLSGYPKAEGIMHSLRCLSPDVIICDELGGKEDIEAALSGVHAGVKVIFSMHAGSIGEVMARTGFDRLWCSGVFRRAAVLMGKDKPGRVSGVYDLEEAYDPYCRSSCSGLFGADRCLNKEPIQSAC